MNEVNLPAIEPVTDEDVRAAVRRGEIAVAPFLQQALEQDRRRVAERQAGRARAILPKGKSVYPFAAEIERLRAELEEANERAAGLGEESARFRAEVALRNSEVELFRGELKRRCDEVARLTAACAAMQERCARACEDEARIWEADGKGPECVARLCAARIRALPNATAAGKGWIDATGAVEAVVSKFPAFDAAKIMVQQEVPDEWAGSRVLIVMKP